MKPLPALPLLPLVACLGLIASTAARAEPNPYYIGASQTFTHDNNIFRGCQASETDAGCPKLPPATALSPNIPEVADTISTTSLLGGFDQPISRQRFYANGTFRHNRYKNHSELNNNGYSLKAGWDWATIEHLSGTLSAALNRQIAQYSLSSDTTTALTDLNVETNRLISATAALGGVTKLTFEGGLTHRSVDYSNVAWAGLEYRQNAGNLGIKYRPSDLLTLGAGLRETRGEYDPSGAAGGPQDYRRHDLDLTALWLPSGASTVDARLSFGRQRYDVSSQRDFSGATGALQWTWKPTGKTNFITLLMRDTGTETGFLTYRTAPTSLQLLTQAGDTSRLASVARVQADYEATAKIKLTGNLGRTHRSLVGISGLTLLAESGSDDTTTAALGVRYAPTRNIQLGCDWSRETRTVSSSAMTLSYPYRDHVYSCLGQILLQ